ncbi:MAG TPA: hypothetical protein VEH81_03990 [Ktedonobacteraceae bacterium]|nr:hypothetical protein [Ktedonobacteraceae bacterium]
MPWEGGQNGDIPVVVAFYAATLSLMNMLYLLLWWYATSHHRLVPRSLDKDLIRTIRLRRLIQLSLFVISIGLALINPLLAEVVWIIVLFAMMATQKVYERSRVVKEQ